jgi:hypothetical protein
MCTVLLPPGVNPVAVQYISYHHTTLILYPNSLYVHPAVVLRIDLYLVGYMFRLLPSSDQYKLLVSRLAVNLKLSPNVATIMTGHGNIRSYLHRLQIIGSTECPRNHGIQTADRLIFQCKRLRIERATLKSSVLKVGKWPVSKSELTNRNLKQFINYINSINFEKLNQSNE